MKSSFRKILRVGSPAGGTKWYLSNDCLLAAKRTMYAVEYRRFYLRDLEYITVWPSPLWLSRVILPAVVLAGIGVPLWEWVDSIAGEIFVSLAVAWIALELALGPTAKSRIRTTGATVDLPLVKRTRRAHKVLAIVDTAVLAARGVLEQATIAAVLSANTFAHTQPDASAPASVAAATQTNAS